MDVLSQQGPHPGPLRVALRPAEHSVLSPAPVEIPPTSGSSPGTQSCLQVDTAHLHKNFATRESLAWSMMRKGTEPALNVSTLE